MADDPNKKDYRDRDRINVHEEHELRYWSDKFKITPDKLKETVKKAGVMVTDVEKALK